MNKIQYVVGVVRWLLLTRRSMGYSKACTGFAFISNTNMEFTIPTKLVMIADVFGETPKQ